MAVWRRLGPIIICICLVASSPAATGIAPTHPSNSNEATSAINHSPYRAYQADDSSASIKTDNLSVTRGDEITFTISHSDSAVVRIGGDDYGFNVTVKTGGSGSTEITMDTLRTTAADPSKFISGGSPTLHSNPLDEPIKPAVYPIVVTINSVERDVATFEVTARQEMTSEGYRAPSSLTPDEYVGGGEGVDANTGPLQDLTTAGTNVTRRSYAVARIEESGLETALNSDDLTGSPAANGLRISVTQDAPIPNQRASEYIATESSRVTVLPNFAADEIYVIFDTTGIELAADPSRNRYTAEVALTTNSSFVDEPTTLSATTFRLREATVSLSTVNGSQHHPWDPDSFVVRGETNRVPQTPLEIRLRGSGAKSFLEISDTTVDSDGEFRATLDLSTVPLGTDARLWVYNHSEQTEQMVRLVAPNPQVDISNQTVNGTTISIDTVEIHGGGYIYIKAESGQLAGRSDYLAPGRYTDVEASLTGPLAGQQSVQAGLIYAGENESYDSSATRYTYWQNDTYVTDTALISVPQTPTETLTPTPTRTDTTSTTTSTGTPYPVVTQTSLSGDQVSGAGLSISPIITIAAMLALSAVLARRR